MSSQAALSASSTPVTDGLLREIVQRIVVAFNPETIILFALDVLVRTPAELSQLIEKGFAFFQEITAQGKVLYERRGARLDTEGRGGLPERAHPSHKKHLG